MTILIHVNHANQANLDRANGKERCLLSFYMYCRGLHVVMLDTTVLTTHLVLCSTGDRGTSNRPKIQNSININSKTTPKKEGNEKVRRIMKRNKNQKPEEEDASTYIVQY